MRAVFPPAAYNALIRREPGLALDGVEPASLRPGDPLLGRLHEVNGAVNRMATHQDDPPGRDTWGVFRRLRGRLFGDCDDFAVEKLRRLLDLGCPRGALRLAVCRIPRGPWHCVLLVEVEGRGALVLDSRRDEIEPLSPGRPAGYRWRAAERPGLRYFWEKIE